MWGKLKVQRQAEILTAADKCSTYDICSMYDRCSMHGLFYSTVTVALAWNNSLASIISFISCDFKHAILVFGKQHDEIIYVWYDVVLGGR